MSMCSNPISIFLGHKAFFICVLRKNFNIFIRSTKKVSLFLLPIFYVNPTVLKL